MTRKLVRCFHARNGLPPERVRVVPHPRRRLRFVEQKVAKQKAVGRMVVERKAVQGQPVELAEPGEQKPGERRRT